MNFLSHEQMRANVARHGARTTTMPAPTGSTLLPFQPPEPTPEILGTLAGGVDLTHAELRKHDARDYISVLEKAPSLTKEGEQLLGNLRSLSAEISTRVRRETRAQALAAVKRTGWAETPEQLAALNDLQADRDRRLNLAASGKGLRITDRSGMAKTPEQLQALDRAYGLTD